MLELYHHGSSVCAAKARFFLEEKGLEWTGHYLDILKGDQFTPEYQKLNPKAVVPTLVHDGQVIVESTVIGEYLDEAFPEPPLKPAGVADRARMRVWTKIIDEELHPACGEVTFVSCHRHILRRLPPEELKRFLENASTRPGEAVWRARRNQIVELGLETPGIAAKFKLYEYYLHRIEQALEQGLWLAGERFSLADIGMTPYVNRLDMLGMSAMWTQSLPRVTDWFERIKSRPTFKKTFIDWCPPDLIRDLGTYGSQTWPEVRRMLAAA